MFGETIISYAKLGNHPIETTIYKWLFGVPGSQTSNLLQIVVNIYLPVTVANEGLSGLSGFPIKNAIFLVVTVTGRGPHPTYTLSIPIKFWVVFFQTNRGTD